MFRIQTKRAVVTSTSWGMFWYLFAAILTGERVVYHYKSHNLFFITILYAFHNSIVFFCYSVSRIMSRCFDANIPVIIKGHIWMMVWNFCNISYKVYKIESCLKVLKFKLSNKFLLYFLKILQYYFVTI